MFAGVLAVKAGLGFGAELRPLQRGRVEAAVG